MAAKFNVCSTTIRWAIGENLRCKSHRLKLLQMLSNAMKTKSGEILAPGDVPQAECGQADPVLHEKIFCVDAKFNRQNDSGSSKTPRTCL